MKLPDTHYAVFGGATTGSARRVLLLRASPATRLTSDHSASLSSASRPPRHQKRMQEWRQAIEELTAAVGEMLRIELIDR